VHEGISGHEASWVEQKISTNECLLLIEADIHRCLVVGGNSARAAVGVLSKPGLLCAAHRSLARNAAEWPLSTLANAYSRPTTEAQTGYGGHQFSVGQRPLFFVIIFLNGHAIQTASVPLFTASNELASRRRSAIQAALATCRMACGSKSESPRCRVRLTLIWG